MGSLLQGAGELPEPHIQMFPEWTPDQIRFAVVLRFTADIT